MKEKYSFNDALRALQAAERPKRIVLQGLHDLGETEARQLLHAWPQLSVERRRWLVETLGDLAEDNIEFDFARVYRVALSDPDEQVREMAVDSLWENEDEGVCEQLVGLLRDDPAPAVRAAAASALGQYTFLAEMEELDDDLAASVRQALLSAFYGAQPLDVRRRAVEALGYWGSSGEVQQIIAGAYGDPEPSMRISALFAMGRSADSRWLGTLLKELQNEDAELRFEATRALGEIEDEAAVPGLARAAQDEDGEVRLGAIEALGHIGGPQATEVLRELSRGQDEAVAEAAETALTEAAFYDAPLGMGLDGLGLDVKDLGKKKHP
ncbi:MAG: HEAT repeat domain-containing protein [Chloroflexota bacterium]